MSSVSFADFLAAKFALDKRSLNPEVLSALLQCLRDMPSLECLDVGAGTGATVRRLLSWRPSQPWRLTALDRDADVIAIAHDTTRQVLAQAGERPAATAGTVRSHDGRIEVCFAACELAAHRPRSRYDLVTAHAVLDLVALAPTLTAFARWLRPDGLLYATINCDGEPEILPRYHDADFEHAVLACYTASMEERAVDGLRSGGAYCGRRLQALLPQRCFPLLAQGCSDWDIRPDCGAYRDRDPTCLKVLLDLMWKEASASGRFDEEALQCWREDRMRTVHACKLEMRVPNRDLLARYTAEVLDPVAF
jgi:SAM-dependent methyltransferase